MFDMFNRMSFLKKQGKIKVSVVGNCQSRPISNFLTLLNEQIEINCIAVVHLLKSEQAHEYEKYFQEADFIISQLVADTYPCDFVRTNALKAKYSSKVISIVNLYYKGYNPELIYIRNTRQGTLKSPLSEYHNEIFLESWQKGLKVEDTIKNYIDVDYNREKYSKVHTNSINELKNREKLVDIKITDFIEENLLKQKLFFVFNHPNNFLIKELSKRIIKEMGIKITNILELKNIPEGLNKIEVPTNVSMEHTYKDFEYFKGLECFVDKNGNIKTARTKVYTTEEIIVKYFEIYNKVLVPHHP